MAAITTVAKLIADLTANFEPSDPVLVRVNDYISLEPTLDIGHADTPLGAITVAIITAPAPDPIVLTSP